MLVAVRRIDDLNFLEGNGDGQPVDRLVIGDVRLVALLLVDEEDEFAVIVKGQTMAEFHVAGGVVGAGKAGSVNLILVRHAVAVGILHQAEGEHAGFLREALGRLPAGDAHPIADGGVALLADDQIAVAQDAAAVGIGGIARHEDLCRPQGFCLVARLGMAGQAGDGNADQLFVDADAALRDRLAVHRAAPAGAVVAEHAAADIAGQGTEIILIMGAVVAFENRIVGRIDAIDVLGGVGAGQLGARSGVFKEGNAMGDVLAGIVGIDSAGGTARQAAAVTAGLIVDDEDGLHVQIAVVADEDAAAAPVMVGIGAVVGDVAAGDLAVAAVIDDDAAALIAAGEVTRHKAAGHPQIAAVIPAAVEQRLDAAAANGLIGCDPAAGKDHLAQHSHAAAAGPAAVGEDLITPVIGDVAFLHVQHGVMIDVDGAAAGAGPGPVAGEDNAVPVRTLTVGIDGQRALVHVDRAAVIGAVVGENHIIGQAHIAVGIDGPVAGVVVNAALDIQLAVAADVEDDFLSLGGVHKADLIQIDAVMPAGFPGAGVGIAAGGDHVALGDEVVEVLRAPAAVGDIRRLAEGLSVGILHRIAVNELVIRGLGGLDGQRAAAHVKERLLGSGDVVEVHFQGGIRRDDRGAFALEDIAAQRDLHAGQAQAAGSLQRFPAVDAAAHPGAGDLVAVADDLGQIGAGDRQVAAQADVPGQVDVLHIRVANRPAQLLFGADVQGDLALPGEGQGMAVFVDVAQVVHIDLGGKGDILLQRHPLDIASAEAVADLAAPGHAHHQAAVVADGEILSVEVEVLQDAVVDFDLLVHLDAPLQHDGRGIHGDGLLQLGQAAYMHLQLVPVIGAGDGMAVQVQPGEILDGEVLRRGDIPRQLHPGDDAAVQRRLQLLIAVHLRHHVPAREAKAVGVDGIHIRQHQIGGEGDIVLQLGLHVGHAQRSAELGLIVDLHGDGLIAVPGGDAVAVQIHPGQIHRAALRRGDIARQADAGDAGIVHRSLEGIISGDLGGQRRTRGHGEGPGAGVDGLGILQHNGAGQGDIPRQPDCPAARIRRSAEEFRLIVHHIGHGLLAGEGGFLAFRRGEGMIVEDDGDGVPAGHIQHGIRGDVRRQRELRGLPAIVCAGDPGPVRHILGQRAAPGKKQHQGHSQRPQKRLSYLCVSHNRTLSVAKFHYHFFTCKKWDNNAIIL